jgi:hypothetical protein
LRYCTKANGTKDDDDWFKFILPDNSDSYLSFIPDSGVYDITVYDENKNVMGKNDYPSVYNKTIYNVRLEVLTNLW